MRLRCNDGKVREFQTGYYSLISGWIEAKCIECGHEFGVHDTKILKPFFKAHVCSPLENPHVNEQQ